MKLVTMGQGTAERYVPQCDREICISITSPGCPDANLSARFAGVLRLQFEDDPFSGWRERARVISHEQSARVAHFLAKHVEAPVCVIHCTVGVSRSVSMALAIEAAELATYEKPDWWAKLDRRRVPNAGVYSRVLLAIRGAQRAAWEKWGESGGVHA